MTSYNEFLTRLHMKKPQPIIWPKCVMALDPGETTGIAIFKDNTLFFANQLNTSNNELSMANLESAINIHKPNIIVYEDYVVYGWKSKSHSWAELHTPKLIGMIEALASIHRIPTYKQLAQQPKSFCTDEKLKSWNMYAKGQKHARDAIRHGTYYLAFNYLKKP